MWFILNPTMHVKVVHLKFFTIPLTVTLLFLYVCSFVICYVAVSYKLCISLIQNACLLIVIYECSQIEHTFFLEFTKFIVPIPGIPIMWTLSISDPNPSQIYARIESFNICHLLLFQLCDVNLSYLFTSNIDVLQKYPEISTNKPFVYVIFKEIHFSGFVFMIWCKVV